ncbi:hypothetical protein LZ578_08220 [Jeotgalibaca sp. MA1X17-3]|uniref:hypothetical protein n=1 Tax=Jeotgalibaca sp. MA1X17-3 TaxID=2908211 RepID=UPI001F19DE42|nr:hypothetical protein [Jeotgalibaca sp. MA1X17-3]UJF14991.1 hypothetical protein LZ578_08220 [Jeotgalibaca sp. MA1X17-3]
MAVVEKRPIDKGQIIHYFNLSKCIKDTKLRKELAGVHFYDQNFYTRIGERFDETQTIAFRVETEVVNHVEYLYTLDRRVEELEFKQKHFNRFWGTLTDTMKEYYSLRFDSTKGKPEDKDQLLDDFIISEILEIEEAAGYNIYKKEVTDQLLNFPEKIRRSLLNKKRKN